MGTRNVRSSSMIIARITEPKKSIHNEHWLYRYKVQGVGIIVAPSRLKNIIQEEYVNEQILAVKIKLVYEEIWTLIIEYGVNENARKEEKDNSFEKLQNQIDKGEENVIVIGDLNGQVWWE